MKKRQWMHAAIALVLFGTVSAASAAKEGKDRDGTTAQLNGAEVINPPCTVRTRPEEPLNRIPSVHALAVFTPSGEIILTCHAVDETGTVEPFSQTGFPCNLGGVPATYSHVVWTPSGHGTLVCRA